MNPTENPAELDNNHIRIVRYVVAPQHEVVLPILAKESVLVFLRGNLLKRVPEKGRPDTLGEGPGSAIWNRVGIGYSIKNPGETPVEFLVVELKDSYSIGQINVPWSERDPAYMDPKHFRVVMANPDVRVLRLHLDVRDGTEECQHATRLEIPLGKVRLSRADPEGKTQEESQEAGSVAWKEHKLESITNIGAEAADMVIVELKHPFCFKTSGELPAELANMGPTVEVYLRRVLEGLQKKWFKNMPRVVREGEKGLVVLQFKVQRDGTVPEDGILFQSVFANDSLAEKAISSIRQAGPFSAFPGALDKPYIKLQFMFLYNLPRTRPMGCP